MFWSESSIQAMTDTSLVGRSLGVLMEALGIRSAKRSAKWRKRKDKSRESPSHRRVRAAGDISSPIMLLQGQEHEQELQQRKGTPLKSPKPKLLTLAGHGLWLLRLTPTVDCPNRTSIAD